MLMLAIHVPTLIWRVASAISCVVARASLLTSAVKIASKPASSASRATALISAARHPAPGMIPRPSRSSISLPPVLLWLILRGPSRDEQDFADMAAGFHQAMRLRGLGQRELLVGERAQFAGRPERPDLFPYRGDDRGFLGDAARTQGRAGHRQMLALDQAEIGLDLAAAHQCHKAEPALMRQEIELARDVVAANHVEDRIDATAVAEFFADAHEILRAVVDRNIGAVVAARPALLVRPRGGQHLGAERLASWIAVTPMPLDPPCTRNTSPGWRCMRSNTLVHTVQNVSGRPPASTRLTPAGTGRHWTAGTAAYSP